MWQRICELFNDKPICFVKFEATDKVYRVPCYSYEEAKGFSNAIIMFEITDKAIIVDANDIN